MAGSSADADVKVLIVGIIASRFREYQGKVMEGPGVR